MHDKNTRTIIAFTLSAIFIVAATAAATIGAELYAPLKGWLANTFTHHWIGKSILSFAGFLVIGVVLTLLPRGLGKPVPLLYALFWTVLLSTLAIIGFFYYEAFLAVHA